MMRKLVGCLLVFAGITCASCGGADSYGPSTEFVLLTPDGLINCEAKSSNFHNGYTYYQVAVTCDWAHPNKF